MSTAERPALDPCSGCHDTGVFVTVEPGPDGAAGGDVRSCPLCGLAPLDRDGAAKVLAGQLVLLTIAAGAQLSMIRADDALVFVTTGREADTLERLIRAQHPGGEPLT